MATFQDLLGAVAQVVGGTQPDAVNNPFWYSGFEVGDGTGVAGIKGCMSVPPGAIQDTPMAFCMGSTLRLSEEPRQGIKGYEDMIRIQLFVGRVETSVDYSVLDPFRDLIPAAFDSHMQLFATANVLDAVIIGGNPAALTWASQPYIGWDFHLRVRRLSSIIYSA